MYIFENLTAPDYKKLLNISLNNLTSCDNIEGMKPNPPLVKNKHLCYWTFDSELFSSRNVDSFLIYNITVGGNEL